MGGVRRLALVARSGSRLEISYLWTGWLSIRQREEVRELFVGTEDSFSLVQERRGLPTGGEGLVEQHRP